MADLWFYELPLLGRCGVEVENGAVRRLLLGLEAVGENMGANTSLQAETAKQLTEYVQGERHCFDIPCRPSGTAFQLSVWRALRRIPWGEQRTYGQIAEYLGVSGGARAVGNAVGANPIPIIIPCHRVLAAGGRLGGFRLGREMKEELLNLEHTRIIGRKIEKI